MSRLVNIVVFVSFLLRIGTFIGTAQVSSPYRGSSGPGEWKQIDRRVDSLLVLMTLDEKVGQLVQWSDRFAWTGPRRTSGDELLELVRQGRVGSLLNTVGAEKVRMIQRVAVDESRLKIPLIFGLDVIHGFRTTFPIPLAESCTWDPGLLERAERVAAVEATASGIQWTFGPMVDIARDPRWGRIAEGAGEDPWLGAKIAAARVRGFQGTRLDAPDALAACAKHFAAYGGAEGGRDYNTVDISGQTLRDVYLPPFHAAVDAGALTLMCSFNEIAGLPSSGNQELLTDILRDAWGFKGFVVSDWGSIGEMQAHGFAEDLAHAGALAIHAGVDMDMESHAFADHLARGVQTGTVVAEDLHCAVRRVLRVKFALGLFDDPYKNCSPERERRVQLRPEHRDLARTVAQQSIVLLRNEHGLLPLSNAVRTIALVGPLAESRADPLGPWDACGDSSDVISVVQGLRDELPPSTALITARGCTIEGDSRTGFAEAVAAARRADVVIAVVGESRDMSGEAASRSSLELPGVQLDLVKELVATGKPVVVLLMNGRPLAISWIGEHATAVVEAWFLGVETGHAIADILLGRANPSGKLTTTFPIGTGQEPLYYNHKSTGRPADDTVKYTSRYIDVPSRPLYPFGYGLSYTAFEYGAPRLHASRIGLCDTIGVEVDVRNTGKRSGEEIVQVYVRDEVGSLTRPVLELKSFRKVPLAPGERRKVRFAIPVADLAFTNALMKSVVEPGWFTVGVGPNSRDLQTLRVEVVPD